MSHADTLGDALYDALNDEAHVPSPVPTPDSFEPHDTYAEALAAFLEEAQRNAWRAFAHEIGGLWIPAIPAPVVVGSTVSSFTVGSGLSLDTDGEWLLLLRLLLATGTSHAVRIGLRGTFVDATNYHSTGIRDDSAPTKTAGELFIQRALASPDQLDMDLRFRKRAGGRTTISGGGTLSRGSPIESWVEASSGVDLASGDIARLDVGSNASNRILANSEAMLLKRVT